MSISSSSTKAQPVPSASAFVSRRQFIQSALATLAAAWAGVLLQTRLFANQAGSQATQSVTFPLDELPVGSSKPITYAGSSAIVLRTPESLRAFSLICTHLGCTVQWQNDQQAFYCPCHDGRFDQFGEVTGGPPPIPLESIPVRVEDGRVIVGEEA